MMVKTAVQRYRNTEKEIFLQSKLGIGYVDKNDDIEEKFGTTIARTKVKKIDEHEAPDSVTIYFET